MPMRLSGLMSGMDTESIIQQLVEAKKTKVTKAVKAQKSLKYKQDAWKDMNKKILNLYNKSLGNMRFESSFIKKVTKVSNSSVVSVITGEGAMNSVQNLEVDNLARSGYLTGGKLGVYPMKNDGTLDYSNFVEGKAYALDADGNVDKTRPMVDITGKTTLKQLGLEIGDGEEGTLQVKVGNEITGWITVEGDSTVENFVQTLRNAGVNANFDEVNQRLYVASKASGSKNDFEITALDGRGFAALNALKLSYDSSDPTAALKTKYEAIAKWRADDSDVDPNKDPSIYPSIDSAARQAEIDKRVKELHDELVLSYMDEQSKKGELLKYKDVINKKLAEMAVASGTTTAVKIDEKFDYNSLKDSQKEELSKAVSALMEDAKNDVPVYAQKLKDLDAEIAAETDPDKKAKLEEDKAKLEADKAFAEDVTKAMETWVSDWQKNSDAIKKLESQLNVTVKDDGTIDIADGLQAAEITKIEAQIDAEAKNAMYELGKLAEYSAMSNDQKAAMKGKKQNGEDAQIKLNNEVYTSDKNTFEINGITLTVNAKPANGEIVTITTEDDTNGIYDMVKNFFKEYNSLINQMDKMYNAESSKGYDPLTDEEKEAMSDSAIEEWENKIKDSILRKDSTLGTFANELKKIMMEGVEVNGKKTYLSDFGIGTLNYFLAPENEKSAYHIDGDPDDENTSGNPDKLKSMIANDPDTVVSFFTQLSQKLYDKMFDMMKSKEGYSSAMTAYDDKKMQTDYDDYTAKIKELEKKLADYEDKWYAKFAAMETALAKMQNNASAVTSLLGG